MIRMPLPEEHNDTTERFKREYPEGIGSVADPSPTELFILGVVALCCIVGFTALILSWTGLI